MFGLELRAEEDTEKLGTRKEKEIAPVPPLNLALVRALHCADKINRLKR